jgi:catechol 2,3-dioxygenase-like lactoylglutathione lyase family enzyme
MTKKISHFGILVHDADAATKLWTEAFGLKMIEVIKRQGDIL